MKGPLGSDDRRDDDLASVDFGPLRDVQRGPWYVRIDLPSPQLQYRSSLLHDAPPEWVFV